jgi:hypothetical protein
MKTAIHSIKYDRQTISRTEDKIGVTIQTPGEGAGLWKGF